ncbi:MAG: hypothetical protein LVQ95_05220 [Candidatus Micrarchaeales archaeon]|nr:hypothetical protein [Candidatus Micrarchaeales archaeon]
MKRKLLKFSGPFIKVQYLEDVTDYDIKTRTILLNIGENPVLIAGKALKPWHSSIFANTTVPKAQKLVSITIKPDYISQKSFKYAAQAKKKWTRIYKLYPLQKFKNTNLWRSDTDKAGRFIFYLWFASAGTDCRIHKHPNDFKEIHTQIFGVGRMQKFHENKQSSIYQEVFMSPGYTHEPFYNAKGKYPWHAYYADTDCIWLAIEGAPSRVS